MNQIVVADEQAKLSPSRSDVMIDRYRPEIDGLRAIAVIFVVLFHLSLSKFGLGGFIGVDVFFVISGYLITRHLRQDLSVDGGGITDFYKRRVIRIFPALFAVYAACALTELIYIRGYRLDGFEPSLLSSLFFVSNIHFYRTLDYFAFHAMDNALLHTWSLSVEEQFYLLLPLILLPLRGFSDRGVGFVLFAVAIISLIATQYFLSADVSAAFYMMPLRAWELLAGSVLSLAFRSPLGSRWLAEGLTCLGLIAIIASGLMLREEIPFPGLTALPAVAGTALVLFATQGRQMASKYLLSIPPMRFFGKISYSLYLWHWPVIVYSKYIFPEPSRPQKLILFAISIVLAWISWKFVEQPVRVRGKTLSVRKTLPVAGFAMAAIACIAISLPLLNRSLWPMDPRAEAALGVTKAYGGPDRGMQDGRCFMAEPKDRFDAAYCLSIDPRKPNILIVGDSHAAQLWSGLSRQYPNLHFLQATRSGCAPVAEADAECRAFMAMVLDRFLARHHLDGIILSLRWGKYNADELRPFWRQLASRTDRLIVVGPFPEYHLPLPELVARSHYLDEPDLARRYLRLDIQGEDQLIAKMMSGEPVRYVSPYALFCRPDCAVLDADGLPNMFDVDHLTRGGSLLFARRLPPGLLTMKAVAAPAD